MKSLFAFLALLGMSSANAVVYDFDGVIDRLSIKDTNDITGIKLGTPFSGFLNYEQEASIFIGSTSDGQDIFLEGVREYQFVLGSHTYFNLDSGPGAFLLRGSTAQFRDFGVRADTKAILADDLAFTFKGVAGSPPSLDQFDSAQFALAFFLSDPMGKIIGGGSAEGEITSFARAVPEPGTYALFALGLLGVLFGTPRRRRGESPSQPARLVPALQ